METFDLHISDELTKLDGGLRLGAALRWSLHMSSGQNDIEEYAKMALNRARAHHQNVRLLVESVGSSPSVSWRSLPKSTTRSKIS